MIKDEKGAALLTAVMLLVILTIIGMASVNTTLFEQDIAHNESCYRQGFYKADGGISVATRIATMGGGTVPPADMIPPEGVCMGSLSGVDIPDDAAYAIRIYPAGSDNLNIYDSRYNRRILVRSKTADPTGHDAIVTIEALIELPASGGLLESDGNRTSY